MPLRDDELPIAEEFHGLVGKAQSADLAAEEKRYLAEKAERERLFALNNPGRKTASQTFLPADDDGEKLKSQVDAELAAQAAARKAATEKQDAQATSDFPPPVITS